MAFETPAKVTYFNAWDHDSWGNKLYFMDWHTRRITGHMPNPPRVGDEVRFRMSSGKVGCFRVTEAKNMTDPPDQFFGALEDLGYSS